MNYAEKLLAWFDQHGRHDLPWQGSGAYGVWLSEIMLQQTQVTTVLPYYAKFIADFPTVIDLANSNEEQVMANWAGLGYYNRARNLHRTAKIIRDEYDGEFPAIFDDVLALPGVGRSTAGAILTQAFGQRHAILDGNVKRILARQFMASGWTGSSKTQKVLWQYAENLLPEGKLIERMADYTQASMDLGALLCRRKQPLCGECPVSQSCRAYQQNRVANFPEPKLKSTKPVKHTIMLLCQHNNETLLYKRPPAGVWPSLWSLPEISLDGKADENTASDFAQQWLLDNELSHVDLQFLPPFRHTFSHYHLDIIPIIAQLANKPNTLAVHEQNPKLWYNITEIKKPAMPAPVSKLLTQKTALL